MKTENGSTLVVDVGIRGSNLNVLEVTVYVYQPLQVQLLIIRH